MEYLSRLLKSLQAKPNFNYHPKCERMHLVHLGFADDLLLFCRGDKLSVQMIYECFTRFSSISGLIVNISKSSIYLGGRLLLIKTVLFSIQVYRSQIFVLPKKVLKAIEAACRIYLWTGGTEQSKKALLAWDTVCFPRSAGGYNVIDLYTWNKAAICKLLWCLCKKKDRLWVQWIHIYYGRHQPVLEHTPKQTSWVVRKILKAKDYLQTTGLSVEEILDWNSFSIKKLYLLLRGNFSKAQWRRLTCNNGGLPKWSFIVTVVAQRRLLTRDRLASVYGKNRI
ncbi:uncharacterized protein LOC132624530 [Lycium barbarum]|uniref:uncharacterized protein LOC132624530 n=1 Tax=Lycium barbarum TaxID=112863 RepID=UPI00293E41AE|nr:uncharacterized protein LOC132624530 [Lycium barbarum]